MKRRTVLATMSAGVLGAIAGCSSESDSPAESATPTATATSGASEQTAPFEHPGTLGTTFVTNGAYPTDENPADGRPPTFPDQPDSPDPDPTTFETLSVNGETVELAPIDTVETWYRRGEVRFVDARGLEQYERAHVYGSVLSTAQRNSAGGGIGDWDESDRIVTYCGCPHHLSSIRAAGLQKAGFENVYALDEGFGEWSSRGYPMAGTAFGSERRQSVSAWTISGSVDSEYAGAYVWARTDRQYEAAPIREDGSYRLTLHFSAVSPETTVEIQTPTESVERELGEVGRRA